MKFIRNLKMNMLNELVKSIVGEGYENTLSKLVAEEIDIKSFMLLDENVLKETGKVEYVKHFMCSSKGYLIGKKSRHKKVGLILGR